jgi:cardiolipin synthase
MACKVKKSAAGCHRRPRVVITAVMDDPADQPTFAVDGNQMTLLDTGPRRLDAVLALIDGAERSLRVLYYIYADDESGQRRLQHRRRLFRDRRRPGLA